MDGNLERLQVEYEALQKLLEQRNEDCQNYLKRINELEIGIQKSSKDPEEFNDFQVQQVKYIKDKFGELYSQHTELQRRFFHIMAKKNDYKKKFLIANATQNPNSNNSELSKRIAELESQIESLEELNKTENDRASNFQQMYEKSISDFEAFRSKSEESFQLLRSKIYEAREGKDYEKLQSENESLKATVEALTESATKMTTEHEDFINSLATALGCQTLEEITESVQNLIPLKIENEKLKIENENLTKIGSIDQNEAYSSIIDSLRQIQDSLSPQNLNLDHNSPLRQLFAAFSNMLDAAISPNASKIILQPHVRALRQQAKAFKRENLTTNSELLNYGKINSSLDASNVKNESQFTEIKQKFGMSLSPMKIDNAENEFTLPSMKSDV